MMASHSKSSSQTCLQVGTSMASCSSASTHLNPHACVGVNSQIGPQNKYNDGFTS